MFPNSSEALICSSGPPGDPYSITQVPTSNPAHDTEADPHHPHHPHLPHHPDPVIPDILPPDPFGGGLDPFNPLV